VTLIDRDLGRNRAVARRFAAKATGYDARAELQHKVAAGLAGFFPARTSPSVLEIGCGTGLLTRHLLERYPSGRFLVSDLASEMLEQCKARFGANPACRFAVLDGETPETGERFDVIAASMALQWFSDPLAGLERLTGLLNPGGILCFATLGPDNFPEWRGVLDAEGLPVGSVRMPVLPGIVHEEKRTVAYGNGRSFLSAMRDIGASAPRRGYQPLPAGALRRALRRLEREHGARVTWHIVYGQVAP
jgi:malonyl-CoA O-methyltransferase